MSRRIGRLWLVGLLPMLLMACGTSEEDELRQWMREQRQQTRPQVKPIPEPKQFVPEQYVSEGLSDPFSRDKLTLALKQAAAKLLNNPLLAPELKRRKEPLEELPLDTMMMVGSVMKEGRPLALIRADKLLYQVRVGNYLGQNYGRVVKITETEVVLREIAQDPSGAWVERPASLLLQEKAK